MINTPSAYSNLTLRLILMLFFSISLPYLANAQVGLQVKNQNLFPQKITKFPISSSFNLIYPFKNKKTQYKFSKIKIPRNPFSPITKQPKAYSFKNLALFCKIEVQLEKLSKIPVKFRLGSVDYVDKLESKR